VFRENAPFRLEKDSKFADERADLWNVLRSKRNGSGEFRARRIRVRGTSHTNRYSKNLNDGRASYACISKACISSVHLKRASHRPASQGVHLMGMHLVGMHLMGADLIGMHLIAWTS
jgi:hypothetical protein